MKGSKKFYYRLLRKLLRRLSAMRVWQVYAVEVLTLAAFAWAFGPWASTLNVVLLFSAVGFGSVGLATWLATAATKRLPVQERLLRLPSGTRAMLEAHEEE